MTIFFFWGGDLIFIIGKKNRLYTKLSTLTCSRYWLHYFFVHNSFKKKDESTRYTHIKVGQRERYFINSINGGGEKMYTDQICNMTDFL